MRNDPKLYDTEYYEANVHFYNPLRFFFHAGTVLACQPRRVLDVGCGPNTFCKVLRTYGVDAVGVDFSKDSGADVIASATDLPFEDNSFDVVHSCDFLEHIEPQDIDRVVDEMLRVGGKQAHHICTEEDEAGDIHGYHEGYHLTVRPRAWWLNYFSRRDMFVEFEYSMHVNVMVGPIPMLGTLCNRLWLFRGDEDEVSFS